MTVETLYADTHVSGTVSTPANALGSTTGTWTSDTGAVSWTSVFGMQNPSGALGVGTHTINVIARKATGTGNPTASVSVYQGATLVSTVVTNASVTSTTGQTLSGTFNSSALSDLTDVRVQVATTAAGGGPSARAAVQVDTIQWTGDFAAVSAVSKTSGTAWSVMSRATAQTATSWGVIGRVTKTSDVRWNTRAQAAKTNPTSWNVLVPVASPSTAAVSWRVRTRTTQGSATTWSDLASAAKTSSSTWNIRSAVAGGVTYWNGSQELACTIAIWDGSQEIPVTLSVTD